MELVEVHGLLNDVSDFIEIIFTHFCMLLDGFSDFHFLLEEFIILIVGIPALWWDDLDYCERVTLTMPKFYLYVAYSFSMNS